MNSLQKSLNPNKHLKEQFVSNLDGSSMLKIAALLTSIPILVLLRHFSTSRVIDASSRDNSQKKNDDTIVICTNLRTHLATLTFDFLSIALPIILFLTVLAEWTYLWLILLGVLLILSIAAKRSTSHLKEAPKNFRTSISSYRVAMMFVTCLSILAVDFRVFPRRYAKTETYGTSLMDLGVGSFVLANSLVSRQARNISSMNWKIAFKSSSPLLLFGFGRLISTSSVYYQVHVGEYGVHWNFFFTLAGVSMLTSLINIPSRYSGIIGSLILIGYQSWVMNGLNLYLLTNERGTDIISRNKEGIFSMLGYWGLYLIGVQVGYYLFFGDRAVLRNKNGTRVRVSLLTILFWLFTFLLDRHVERASRRMCNLTYVMWVLAQNLQILAILMLPDSLHVTGLSALEKAFDQNLLASFLLANVLTGFVNLSVDTLSASSASALSILVLYSLVISLVVGTFDFYGIRLKFW